MADCKCKVLVTADSVYRGDKLLNIKSLCDIGNILTKYMYIDQINYRVNINIYFKF